MAESTPDHGRDDQEGQPEEEPSPEEDFILVIQNEGVLGPNPEWVNNRNKQLLPISDIHSEEGRKRALLEVGARMVWPKDEAKREELILSTAGMNAKEAQPVFDEILRQYGGARRLAECRAWKEIQSDAESQMCGWFVAHMVISNVSRLQISLRIPPNQASVNKAIHLLHEYWPYFPDPALEAVPKNKNEVKSTWARYRSVAHLCSAFELTKNQYSNLDIPFFELMDLELTSILSFAYAIQTWGTTFKPLRSKTYLLPPEELWWLPDELELPSPKMVFFELTDDEIEILKKYRAPGRR